MENYLEKLQRELKYRNYSPKTIKAYSACIKFFLQEISPKNPEDISQEESIDFFLFLQNQKKAPKTINLYKESENSLKIFGTCAGAILCSYLGMDMEVERNAYGAQQDSMVVDLDSGVFENLKGAFIRAPKLKKLGENVRVLASQNNDPVLVEEGNFLAASFHPELVGERRVYEYFFSKNL